MTSAVLLLNLGSPDAPETPEVRRYLREFLSDSRVLDSPTLIRQIVLNLFILPTRPKRSAAAYRKIWTESGSPLIVHTDAVAQLLRERLDIPVEIGMRYGNPSTEFGVRKLLERGPVDRIFVVPLYPHYAMSSYETAVAHTQRVVDRITPQTELVFRAPFYEDSRYIGALAHSIERTWRDDFDALLFSYHGIPERHVRKSDPSGSHCLASPDCCTRPNTAHSTCYRAQVHKTTWAAVDHLGIPREKVRISFQSRLGRDPWLRPFTDMVLEEMPQEGIKKLLVVCPAFVSDCLETLEEIEMEGKESFLSAGGEEFVYCPCLNEDDLWIDTLEGFVADFLEGNGDRFVLSPS
jgi:protoporphyrin/coproporphyrin ferrochelatase